jgi:hypothetical protein
MKYTIEAYDLLVDELKQKLAKSYGEINGNSHQATIISGLLTKQLVRYAGKKAAMEVAREIDKQFNVGFEEWVDEDFEDKKT